MSDAWFPIKTINGIPVVEAPEEIDITNAAELRAALLEPAAQGYATFIVDLSRTLFCDTSGLHVLALMHKRASQGRGTAADRSQQQPPSTGAAGLAHLPCSPEPPQDGVCGRPPA